MTSSRDTHRQAGGLPRGETAAAPMAHGISCRVKSRREVMGCNVVRLSSLHQQLLYVGWLPSYGAVWWGPYVPLFQLSAFIYGLWSASGRPIERGAKRDYHQLYPRSAGALRKFYSPHH